MTKRIILIAEDNLADQALAREVLERSDGVNEIYFVSDGQEVMSFLTRKAPFEHAPRPALIILDLNLPKKHGIEVLLEIKASPGLRRIPVVILTTSNSTKDMLAAYDAHVNSFFMKPVDVRDYFQILQNIESYWLSSVSLPSE